VKNLVVHSNLFFLFVELKILMYDRFTSWSQLESNLSHGKAHEF